MNKLKILAVLIGSLLPAASFAQYPAWGPTPPPTYNPYMQPPPFAAFGGPRMLIGGPLSATKPVQIPTWRDARPLTPATLHHTIAAPRYAPPAARHTTAYSPAQVAVPQAPIQRKLPSPADDPQPKEQPAAADPAVEHHKAAPQPVEHPVEEEWVEVPEEVVADAVIAEPGYYGEHIVEPRGPKRRVPCGYKTYAVGEFLMWKIDDQNLPPVIQAGPAGGIVGFGTVPGDDEIRDGGRVTLGVWLTRRQTWGLEANFLYLDREVAKGDFFARNNFPVARLIVSGTTGLLTPIPVNEAHVAATLSLWGSEAALRKELFRWSHGHIDALGGFRYLNFEEDLMLSDRTVAGAVASLAEDHFRSRSRFYGGFLGLDGELRLWRFYVNAWTKFAFGSARRKFDIDGWTTVVGPGGTTGVVGGRLALPSNIGREVDSEITYIPEAGVKFGFILTDHLRAAVGANILYLNDVIRPADQIDLAVSPTASIPRPRRIFDDTDMTIFGLTAEFELRY